VLLHKTNLSHDTICHVYLPDGRMLMVSITEVRQGAICLGCEGKGWVPRTGLLKRLLPQVRCPDCHGEGVLEYATR
jgi:DnaJ-class molecular chaperone